MSGVGAEPAVGVAAAAAGLRAYSDPVIFRDDRVLRTLLRKEAKYLPTCPNYFQVGINGNCNILYFEKNIQVLCIINHFIHGSMNRVQVHNLSGLSFVYH